MIAKLVDQLEVEDPERLTDQLEELAGRHLRPVHRLLLGSDPASTRKLLVKIASQANFLQNLFDVLPNVVVSYLAEFHESLLENEPGSLFPDIDGIDRSLGELAVLCAKANNELLQAPNAPLKVLRRQTLHDVAAAIEKHTGRTVGTRWSRDDVKCYEFKGLEGLAVLEFMQLVEPGASERSLVSLFRAMRGKTGRKVRTPKN